MLAIVTKFPNTKTEQNGDSVGNTFKIRLEFFSHTEQDLWDPNVDIYIRNGHVNSFLQSMESNTYFYSTLCLILSQSSRIKHLFLPTDYQENHKLLGQMYIYKIRWDESHTIFQVAPLKL